LGKPDAVPPQLVELLKPVARARIWDESTPWLIPGHAAQRAILSDPRASVDEHRPLTIFNAAGTDHTRFRRMMYELPVAW
jgi:hypothetical protein